MVIGKTRTNQPVTFDLPVTADIEHLSDDFLNDLHAGDIIEKKTGDMKHTYIVTYKQEKHGICLSYFDGSGYLETISYDYTDGHWVFNSKDVFNANGDVKIGGNLEVDGILKVNEYELDEDITLSNLPTNLNCYYAHARISNGKLNIVLAFGVASGDNVSALTAETSIGSITLTSEQASKLYPYVSNIVDTKVLQLAIADSPYLITSKTLIRLRKVDNNITISLIQEAISTMPSTGIARFEFNFLLS